MANLGFKTLLEQIFGEVEGDWLTKYSQAEPSTLSPKMRLYVDRFKKGLCYHCGENPIEKSGACIGCHTKHAEFSEKSRKERMAYRKANKLCVDCGEPAMQGYTRCQNCHEFNRKKGRELAQDRIKKGLCVACGAKALPKFGNSDPHLCAKCLSKKQNRYSDLVSQGLCTRCGDKAVPNKHFCQNCLDTDKQKRTDLVQTRLKQGLCPKCGKPRSATSKLCPDCVQKQLANQKRWREQRRRARI